MQFDSKEIKKNPRLALMKMLLYGERLQYEGYSKSTKEVVQTRIDLHEKTGILEESYSKLRKQFEIEIMDVEEDMTGDIGVDIDIFTASSWYNQLSEKKEKEFIKTVALELQKLELSFILIEKYIECLLYDGKLKVPLVPAYSLYFFDVLGDSFSSNLSTEDKRWLKILFRYALKIPLKGAVSKEKKEIWDSFESFILEKSKAGQVRRLKNMKDKFIALEEKKEVPESVGGDKDAQRTHKTTDFDLAVNAYEEEDEDDLRKHAQNIKKHREIIKKDMKKTRE